MFDLQHIIKVELSGNYFGAFTLKEAIFKYSLKDYQVDTLVTIGELKLSDGIVVLTAL